MTLNDIPASHEFRIERVNANGEIRRRLVDMGFIPGTLGRVLRRALLNDPIELQLRGYRVSLRSSEAREIDVMPLPADDETAEALPSVAHTES